MARLRDTIGEYQAILRGLADKLQGLTVRTNVDVQENKERGGGVDEHEEQVGICFKRLSGFEIDGHDRVGG